VRDVGRAISAGLRAPLRRWRLVLLLWLARLVPVFLVVGVPAYDAVSARSEYHPDAGRLLAAAGSEDGFAYQWTSDLFRTDSPAAPDTLIWLIVVTWLLVGFLAGGITARLVFGEAGLFLAECGRYAGRFLRLLVVAAVLVYACDLLINGVLAAAHDEEARLHHTQEFAVRKAVTRGVLFVAIVYLVGLVHSYARIEIVAHERRSAVLAFVRGLGTLVTRLPKLILLEGAMLLAVGAAALVAYGLVRAASLESNSTWAGVAALLVAALFGSYLRSGVELGALEARCRLLGAPVAVLTPSQPETPPGPAAESDDLPALGT
jgi:hypothetical protein